MRGLRASGLLSGVVAALLVLAPSAGAAHHLVSISEVKLDTGLGDTSDFIELEMHAPNQNLVNGTGITVFDATGNAVNGFAITASVASGENQRTILIGDTGVQGRDFTTVAVGTAVGAGGAACYSESASPPYQMIDCVSWGTFVDSDLDFPEGVVGAPASAIPDGQSLQRRRTPGCATLLEAADDTNDSITDFGVLASPTPRGNALAPVDKPCTPAASKKKAKCKKKKGKGKAGAAAKKKCKKKKKKS